MITVESPHYRPDKDMYLPGRVGTACTNALPGPDRPLAYYDDPPVRSESPPVTAEMLREGVPETVFNPDDRDPVLDPRAFPYSAICALEIITRTGHLFYGTGFMIGPRLVLTAGHNVYFQGAGEGFVDHINVYPGLNGDRNNPPFRATTARKFLTVEAWTKDGTTESGRQFDFGAIVLPTDLGNEVGWFAVANLADGTLKALTVNLVGYPKTQPPGRDWPGKNAPEATTQWRHAGQLGLEPNRLRYLIDATEGQSGAPVFAFMPDQPVPYLALGIHNWAYDVSNAATRINDAVFAQIAKWRQDSDQITA